MSKKWRKRRFNLSENHRWKAKPGNKVFVINRGAVHFEHPGHWVVKPEEDGSISLYDGKEPDDNMRLQVSVTQFGPNGLSVDWRRLPSLATQMETVVLPGDERQRTRKGPMLKVQRPNMEYAWLEIDFIDPTEKRKAHSRQCLARGGNVQAFITMEYWPEDHAVANKVWNDAIESLKLAEYVSNPMRGPLNG